MGTRGKVDSQHRRAIAYLAIGQLFEKIGNVNYLPSEIAAWSPDAVFSLARMYLTEAFQKRGGKFPAGKSISDKAIEQKFRVTAGGRQFFRRCLAMLEADGLLRRTKGGWQEIGWDDAFAEAAENLLRVRSRYGPESLATLGRGDRCLRGDPPERDGGGVG